MRTVVVNVTADHIARGQRCNCSFCPVALALTDAFGEPLETGGYSVFRGEDRIASLPFEATAFVTRFDMTGAAEPFSFEVVVK